MRTDNAYQAPRLGVWLTPSEIAHVLPLASQKKVSEVARAQGGFLPVYRKTGGRKDVMRRIMYSEHQSWFDRRNGFVNRHMAQVEKNKEALWDKNGNPTRRHMALIIWAYTPDKARYMKWTAQRRTQNPYSPDHVNYQTLIEGCRDLRGLREIALFAGAGGGILGGTLLGWETVCAVEIDSAARSVLEARQDDGSLHTFPIFEDVTRFNGHAWQGKVDIVTGGFPCQDISVAKRDAKALEGSMSRLWFEMLRIIEEVMPSFVLFENAPTLNSRGLSAVLQGLHDAGYNVSWGTFATGELGAPHKRDRAWGFAFRQDMDVPRCFTQQRTHTQIPFSQKLPRWGLMYDGSLFELQKPQLLQRYQKSQYDYPTPVKSDMKNMKVYPAHFHRKSPNLVAIPFLRSHGIRVPMRDAEDQRRALSALQEAAPKGEPLYLNPDFAEWLLGWPFRWTDVTQDLASIGIEQEESWFSESWWQENEIRPLVEKPQSRGCWTNMVRRIQMIGNGQSPIAVVAAVYFLSPFSTFCEEERRSRHQRPGHRRPNPGRRSLPIVEEAFESILHRVNERVDGFEDIRLNVGCHFCNEDHAKEWRVFAHTLHEDNTICVHPELATLHPQYVYGIMAHEFGHILADALWGDDSEEGADRASEEILSLPISYGSKYRLEYITKKAMESL